MRRVNISKKENVLVPNLPSIAGDVVSCSSQVFPLWLLVSVFTLVGISFSMHGRH